MLGVSTETSSTGWSPPTSGTIPAGHPGAGTSITCPAAIGAGNNVGIGAQSDGETLSTNPSFRGNLQEYILPYSAANWVQQANNSSNPSIDLRGGVRVGGIVGQAPSGTFPPAYAVRWTGTSWRLNDATILGGNETGGRTQSGVTSERAVRHDAQRKCGNLHVFRRRPASAGSVGQRLHQRRHRDHRGER